MVQFPRRGSRGISGLGPSEGSGACQAHGGGVEDEIEEPPGHEVDQHQKLHGSEHGVVEVVHAASLPVVTDRSSRAWTAISAAGPSPGVFTRNRISPGAPRASSVSPACLRISHDSWSSSGSTLAAPGQYESF